VRRCWPSWKASGPCLTTRGRPLTIPFATSAGSQSCRGTAEYLSSREDVAMTGEDSGSQALTQGSVTPDGEVVGAWSDATAD
jgi:hypothetical protein